MTGFGHGEASSNGSVLVAEVRTVNSKFADISVRLPRQVGHLEPVASKLAQAAVVRGKVTVTVLWQRSLRENLEEGAASPKEITTDVELAKAYHIAAKEIGEELGLSGDIPIEFLLRMPEVVTVKEKELDPEVAEELLVSALKAALTDLDAMRLAEGKALERDFLERLDVLSGAGEQIAERAPQRVKEAKVHMDERIAQLTEMPAMDPQRLAMEVAILADRLDITEECVRLRSHIDQFRTIMSDDEAPGRKLNFLLQELNREVNTMGSKSNDATMAHIVIQMKEDIERLREQVQNVE